MMRESLCSRHDWVRCTDPVYRWCLRCNTKEYPGTPWPARDTPFTIAEIAMLRKAGEWNILRPQAGRLFYFTGTFSMGIRDLNELVYAAGGATHQEPGQRVLDEVLVIGDNHDEWLMTSAVELDFMVITEAGLVDELFCTPEELLRYVP